jgi:hypothetical protein
MGFEVYIKNISNEQPKYDTAIKKDCDWGSDAGKPLHAPCQQHVICSMPHFFQVQPRVLLMKP